MKKFLCGCVLLVGLTHCHSAPKVPDNPSQGTAPVAKSPVEGVVLCQAWFPEDASSIPPDDMVACAQDADCTHGEVRGCCQHFVVALNASRTESRTSADPSVSVLG